MTLVWFVVWLLADVIGDRAPVRFDPMNVWAATLILAIGIDVNRPPITPRGHDRDAR